jgi:hypothetical protein
VNSTIGSGMLVLERPVAALGAGPAGPAEAPPAGEAAILAGCKLT